MSLKEYIAKRNFDSTPEPRGSISYNSKVNRFVIQRHKARRLHYDLRLEIGGTLKSWAIPKGPSMNPNDKRLAVRTEDHPLEYLFFEGSIPKGNYGAGTMTIWDSGIFEPVTTTVSLEEQWESGDLKIFFKGQKLRGSFALVRTGNPADKEQWLFIKKKDDYAVTLPYDAETFQNTHSSDRTKSSKLVPGQLVSPMLATETQQIFNDPHYIFELKWDGYRILAHKIKETVVLQSRNGVNYNEKFPTLYRELESLPYDFILDGEVVVVDEKGVANFGALQKYPEGKGQLKYYVFDMLFLNDHTMIDLSLLDRKSLIPSVVDGLSISQYCDHIEGMGMTFYEKAVEAGMEGVMAKEINSTYAPGYRTEKWLKVKSTQSLEAYICGYTASNGSENQVGSLILGIKEDHQLTYIGNCGSGFSSKQRRNLAKKFAPYQIIDSPFDSSINLRGRKPHWMTPFLQCEVNFSERTSNGLLRHPIFKRFLNPTDQTPPTDETTNQKRKLKTSKDVITVDGFQVPISHLDKIYWPDAGLSKYDLIDYYIKVSEHIIPHLKDRPQNLHRHPNGIISEGFYHKDQSYLPEWFETIKIYSHSSNRHVNYLLCQNTASLLYLANLGCIELNPWSSRISNLDTPDYGIIDLDPPETIEFKNVVAVALAFKALLDEIDIRGYCKLSGSKGIHIYIPMGAAYTYEEVRNFIKLLCVVVHHRMRKLTTMERLIRKRKGQIYLDYLQNRRGHTIAAAHSVRPLPNAPISGPLTWETLKEVTDPRLFKLTDYPFRLEVVGDLFKQIHLEKIDIEEALKRIDLVI